MRRLFLALGFVAMQLLVNAQPYPGAEQMSEYPPLLQGKRVAILSTYTARVDGTTVVDTLVKKGINIVKIFSLKWVLPAYRLFPDKNHFFNKNGSAFDRLAGSSILRQQIRDGLSEEAIRKSWEPGLKHFKTIRKKYLLYAE